MKKGLLLINLGTPKSPSKTDIRAYLREFLSDPRVVDINPIGRWFLLNFFILPFRPSKIIKNYEGIYTPNGMPLLIYGQSLAEKMRARLDFPVEFAFRYGDPSIQNKLDHLKSQGCDEIIIFPLYPQYASSSFGSTVEKVYQTLSTEWNTSLVKVVPPFYKHPEFISSA